MIENIGESMLRSTTRVDPSNVVHDKEMNQQKAEQAREARPIEDSNAGAKTEDRKAEEEKSAKFTQVEKTLVFEKYDRNGEVILRIPPMTKPVDQLA